MVVAREWGERRLTSYRLIGIKFQIYKMKRDTGMDGGDGCIVM